MNEERIQPFYKGRISSLPYIADIAFGGFEKANQKAGNIFLFNKMAYWDDDMKLFEQAIKLCDTLGYGIIYYARAVVLLAYKELESKLCNEYKIDRRLFLIPPSELTSDKFAMYDIPFYFNRKPYVVDTKDGIKSLTNAIKKYLKASKK